MSKSKITTKMKDAMKKIHESFEAEEWFADKDVCAHGISDVVGMLNVLMNAGLLL